MAFLNYFYQILCFLIVLVISANASSCKNPKIETKSYTTTDGYVISEVAFVTEITVFCESSTQDPVIFYEKEGQLRPAVKSADGSKFLVSWTRDTKSAYKGEHGFRIYDEENGSAFQKAKYLGEDTSTIPSHYVSLYHPGTYYGPYFPPELIAVFVTIMLFYASFKAKSELTA